MFMLLGAATALALSIASGTAAQPASFAAPDPMNPAVWTIGPIIEGNNHSKGMPLQPTARRGGGWYFDFPRAPGSVHYVTFRHGSLAGKSRIVMRYRVEMAPGVVLSPPSAPTGPSILTLYFQRRGDTWSGRGRYEAYRWYATFSSHMPITAGNHEISAPLNGHWTAVFNSSARSNPRGFRDAIVDADQVGFVLGGGDGYGHGVFATGRARLIVTDFRIE
jgi:hypothetical protein